MMANGKIAGLHNRASSKNRGGEIGALSGTPNDEIALPQRHLTTRAGGLVEGGETGEDGVCNISNDEFISQVFRYIPNEAFAAICSKAGDPRGGGWRAKRAYETKNVLPPGRNNFLNCSSFRLGDEGSFRARNERFSACHFIMLDDLGTKCEIDRLAGFEVSWLIETSPGNFQGGIMLTDPIADSAGATQLLAAAIDAGLCDRGAGSPTTRWARLPVSINGKPAYADSSGSPFRCRLVEWRPEKRHTAQEIIDALQLELRPIGRSRVKATASDKSPRQPHSDVDDVLKPKADENPVVRALKAHGLYKRQLGAGKHDITCPWVQEHSERVDSGAAYFEPDDQFPVGGFCCHHSHRAKFHIRQLLDFLAVSDEEARNKPTIRVVPGALARVVDAAEKELAACGRHFQAGGLIVSINTDQISGDPSIVPTSMYALTRELSVVARWEKYDSRSEDWVNCDPPTRHSAILHAAQNFCHLPTLAGLARQPYFRETDGQLVAQPGYDIVSRRFSVFDETQFVMPVPTIEAARAALSVLEELLEEFHFVADIDKAAALGAIFTAVVRPTLSHAPGIHVKATVYGSGKTYLCELIGAFAGPGENQKVSYPTTSEEATKSLLSLLLTNPAVIEFDDMDTDWIPHGIIKRMFTAEQITDRILGISKTATVSTRTLFLGSGNNVGPVRDLLRRVLTIHIDPRCATPATISYKGSPVKKVRARRSFYVVAVLTIILAWRMSGSLRGGVQNIATFGGVWSDYCRHPLIWLGHPDPAASLLEQVKHDPEADQLAVLMTEWRLVFGSNPTTVRKAVQIAESTRFELRDAMLEFPVGDRDKINRSRLGWLLKKSAGRIVNGFEFRKSEADGRTAWRVVAVAPL